MQRKRPRSIASKRGLDFTGLVDAVRQVCERSAAVASRAVNVSLTLRNWLIGFYIVEYEQHGADRAQYGESLLEKLADALAEKGMAELSSRSLRLYRQFFLTYPGIWQSAIAKSKDSALPEPIWRSLTAKFGKSPLFWESMTPKSKASRRLAVDEHTLITRLSFTHLAELVGIDDPLKRAFYGIGRKAVRDSLIAWALVESTRKLIEIFEAEIKAKVDEIWGEAESN